jgi:prepilin-type N-terminal cleavage/methylation domain-containing protein
MRTSSDILRRRRLGVTLPELLIGLVILAIVAGGLVRLLMIQGRFADTAEAYRNSRGVSRDAYNIMMTDLRMVQDTLAIQKANQDTITVRVPYAYGIVCGTTAGITTVSLVPADSALYSMATYGGVAYRDSATGVFQFTAKGGSSDVLGTGVASACTDTTIVAGIQRPGITQVTYKGRTGPFVTVLPNIGSALPGNPMFLWQEITYAYGPSVAYIGMRGLFRKVTGGRTDEIIAPFDTSAHFRFYVLNNDSSQVGAPANLNTIRGLDLRLNARSPRTPAGSNGPKLTKVMTAVYFKDRRDP